MRPGLQSGGSARPCRGARPAPVPTPARRSRRHRARSTPQLPGMPGGFALQVSGAVPSPEPRRLRHARRRSPRARRPAPRTSRRPHRPLKGSTALPSSAQTALKQPRASPAWTRQRDVGKRAGAPPHSTQAGRAGAVQPGEQKDVCASHCTSQGLKGYGNRRGALCQELQRLE